MPDDQNGRDERAAAQSAVETAEAVLAQGAPAEDPDELPEALMFGHLPEQEVKDLVFEHALLARQAQKLARAYLEMRARVRDLEGAASASARG